MRCAALATRAHAPSGVSGAAVDRHHPPAPPAPGRGHGSGGQPMSPQRPVDADGFARPPGSARLPPPAALSCPRAPRFCARRSPPAPGSRPRRVARGAGDAPPGARRRPLDLPSTPRGVRRHGHQGRLPTPARRRRNQAGRPLSSSPAIHRGGSAAPFCSSLSRAHWGRVR